MYKNSTFFHAQVKQITCKYLLPSYLYNAVFFLHFFSDTTAKNAWLFTKSILTCYNTKKVSITLFFILNGWHALYACSYRNAANWFPDMQKRDMFLYKHNIFL